MKKLIALLTLLLVTVALSGCEELTQADKSFTKRVNKPKENVALIEQPQKTSEPTVIEVVKDNVYFVAVDKEGNIPTLIQRFSEEHERYKIVGIEIAMLNKYSPYGIYLTVEFLSN